MSEAALTHGARQAFFDRAIIPGAPSLTTSSGSGSPCRRMSWKDSRQFAVSSLLPGAGAVLNMMQPAAETVACWWDSQIAVGRSDVMDTSSGRRPARDAPSAKCVLISPAVAVVLGLK